MLGDGDDNSVTPQETGDFERQLELLYARKALIDALIVSLEEYDRYRIGIDLRQRRKSA